MMAALGSTLSLIRPLIDGYIGKISKDFNRNAL